jgi:hypothetical protein
MTPDDPRHGTVNGYTNLKCRCKSCRRAWADAAIRKRKARASRLSATPVEHGTESTYTNWACRCAECRAAGNAQKRRWYAAKQASA